MKKSKKIQLLKFGMSIWLPLGLLISCGQEETIDYSIEGMEEAESPHREGGKSGLEQFQGMEQWKETMDLKIGEFEWDGEMLDTFRTYTVDAQIKVPETKEMSVVAVRECLFDASFRKELAEKMFDADEIYYGDAAHMTRGELQELQNYLNTGGTLQMVSADYSFSVNAANEKLDDLYTALENRENAKEIYTPVEDYTTDEYIGSIDGRMYRLIMAEWDGDSNNEFCRTRRIMWSVKDIYEVCPKEYEEVKNLKISPWTMGDWVDNQCAISEEEALKIAEEFVERLGLDYSVFSYVYPLLWGEPPKYVTEKSSSEGWGVSGYVFCFDLGVDDMSFVSCGAEDDYTQFGRKEDREVKCSMNARLQIYVTEQGVIKAIADNPMEITAISDNVELLPFDTVQYMMKKAMNEQWKELDLWQGHENRFGEMELIYFRISDKEKPGNYNYVPAWRLAAVTRNPVKNKISIGISVLINAIDGSFIDFVEET